MEAIFLLCRHGRGIGRPCRGPPAGTKFTDALLALP
jgi:hypothetical protein